jgi:hypothetical protein
VEPELVAATVHASGTWSPAVTVTPSDTLPVEVSAVELVDGKRFIRVTIGDKPVALDVTAWWTAAPAEIVRSWQAHVEAARVGSSIRLGVGIGYRVCEPWGIGIAPSITVDPGLTWAAAELRVTGRVWSGVAVGGGIGYRIGDDPGLHLSGGISVEL